MHDLQTIIQRNSDEYLKRRGLEREPNPFRPVAPLTKLEREKTRRQERIARRLERNTTFDAT